MVEVAVGGELADRNGMRDGTPEPRTPVMIMVEVSWEDQKGTLQTTRARIENKSSGGACIRLNKKVAVGTQLKIEGQWEKFTGEARYCRQDGRDYLVGIQKNKTEWPAAKRVVGKEGVEKTLPDIAALLEKRKERDESKVEIAREVPQEESVPIASIADRVIEAAVRKAPGKEWSSEKKEEERSKGLEGLKRKEEREVQASVVREADKERKPMRRKWFEMGHKEEREEAMEKHDRPEVMSRMPATVAPVEVVAEMEKEAEPEAQLEMPSMEDIYRVAGILTPRKGYSITKIVEMLHSEHLRGLSKEMKRASVLMALDAAGVTVDEVLQDAKSRQDAIDSYETDQRKQFEGQLARKADENAQIQAEMERVKARYTERLRRNLDGMAREKATFGNWLTLKQQESESMREAVEMCLKPPVAEKPSTPLEEVSLAGARVKPV